MKGDVRDTTVSIFLPVSVDESFYLSATTTIIKVAAFANIAPSFAFETTSEFSRAVPLPPAEICDNNMDDDGDGLIDCEDPDCANYTKGSIIAGDEFSCAVFDPEVIDITFSPHQDPRESIFYQWQKSIDGINWEDIANATAATYNPSTITETTLYRQQIKKHICHDWLVSNVVEKRLKLVATPAFTTTPNERELCSNTPYIFEAAKAGDGSQYEWNFGEFANPSTATGKGPHTVHFTKLADANSNNTNILLKVSQEGCADSTEMNYTLQPIIAIENINTSQPTSCGGTDGTIGVILNPAIDACIALSLDGGETYLPDNQLIVNNLAAGAYDLYLRYCDNDCVTNAGIVNLSDPAAIEANDDIVSGYCPGVLFKANVTNNDTLGDNPVFSIAVDANFGKVTIDENGQFTYLPIANACGMDQFSYKLCNGNTGCCATAIVEVVFGDNEEPTFGALPADITIGSDDEIPAPAIVNIFDNCPATILKFEETDNQGNLGCEKYNYTITRTWTASDQCGNVNSHTQTITVVDETAPDIFKIHNLPNGTKMIGGVMEFTSQHWKTVLLPYNFGDNPIIFTQLVTNNEATAATVRLRNITQNQFEIRLQEAAIDDSIHLKESVAWIALEAGTQVEDIQLQADTTSITHGWTTITFDQSFANIPLLFANMQTVKDAEAASIRNNGVNWNNGKLRIQEENSIDANLAHTAETVGYLAIDAQVIIKDEEGNIIGETGRKKVTHEWLTIELERTYNNPVIIANSLSIDDFDPATVRIANVTATSFDVRVEEWSYLDGNHLAETVGYLVLEGSLPLVQSTSFCEGNASPTDFTDQLIALDNTGQQLNIDFVERFDFTGTEHLTLRDWQAVDLCNNLGKATQIFACPGIAVKAKTTLYGALIGSEDPNLMRDDLRKAGLIPTTEPYTDLDYVHVGASEGVTLTEDLLEVEGKDAIVDWVFLELRSRLVKSEVLGTAVGLVQRDGDIISPRGDSLLVFPNAFQSNYFLSVRHRNHVCMLSEDTYNFTYTNVPKVDFTQLVTTDSLGGILEGTQLAMWPGDMNNDNLVIYQGPQNDLFPILLTILIDPENENHITNYVSKTYSVGDFNLDGRVIYQGPGNDRSLMLFNATLIHPNNTGFISNFIISNASKRGN